MRSECLAEKTSRAAALRTDCIIIIIIIIIQGRFLTRCNIANHYKGARARDDKVLVSRSKCSSAVLNSSTV